MSDCIKTHPVQDSHNGQRHEEPIQSEPNSTAPPVGSSALLERIADAIGKRRDRWAERHGDSEDDEFRNQAGIVIDTLDEITDSLRQIAKDMRSNDRTERQPPEGELRA